MMKEHVTVIFEANGGGITTSSKRLTRGEPYGELPTPSRFGYEFEGWFTAEEGGERIEADTVVTAEESHALYAHWTKNVVIDAKLEAYKKRKAAIKRQKAMIAVAAVLALILIAALIVIMHFVNRTNLTDVDGTVYKIIKTGSTYILCDKDEKKLGMTEDGKYYVTAAGSQIKLDASTGKATIYAYVDTVGKEVVGNIVTARILAFPQVEKASMAKLQVFNDYGGYTFIGVHKDTNGDGKIENTYYIEGHKDTSYNQEQFASLIVSCGYVLAMDKITDPIADENGAYTEYGLASEIRYKADGTSYVYTPAKYILTDVNGNTYTVIVGDAIVSGAGYYVQYINPDYPDTPFIYIVNSDIASTVLQPVEALVEPMIVYPMSLSTYFNVSNFSIARSDTDIVVSFSYVPLEDRLGTQSTTVPYVFLNKEFANMTASSSNIDTCLQSFANMEFIRVVKLAPDDEALITYGISKPACSIYFDYNVTEDDFTGTVGTFLSISSMTSSGTYYIYSTLFDMIVEVDRTFLPFMDWQVIDWIDKTAYSFNLACTSEITLASGSKTIKFSIDNSDSKQFTFSRQTKSSYTRTDGKGTKTSYYLVQNNGKYSVAVGSVSGAAPSVYAENVRYLLTSNNNLYLISDTSTTKLDLTSGTTGTCTLYVTGYDADFDAILYIFVDHSTGVWGKVKRTLSSDSVRVTGKVNTETAVNVTTLYFRHFFQTILYASADGVCNLTDEEKTAFRSKPDSEAQLVMTIKTEDGDFTFRFYQYSERRSYMTINGSGELYILSDRVVKILNDALKVIAGEDVTATAKN
jgi:uncharacterized repeat protein (TIGR02543 family)